MRIICCLFLTIFCCGCLQTDLSDKSGEIYIDSSNGYNQELKQLSDEVTKINKKYVNFTR